MQKRLVYQRVADLMLNNLNCDLKRNIRISSNQLTFFRIVRGYLRLAMILSPGSPRYCQLFHAPVIASLREVLSTVEGLCSMLFCFRQFKLAQIVRLTATFCPIPALRLPQTGNGMLMNSGSNWSMLSLEFV